MLHKKVLPYYLPSIGPGADPGVQAVSTQVTLSHLPGIRLPLLSTKPPVTSLQLPSQLKSVNTHQPVPNYTAWWQRHMRVSSLPKAVTWKQTSRDLNLRHFWSWAITLLLRTCCID